MTERRLADIGLFFYEPGWQSLSRVSQFTDLVNMVGWHAGLSWETGDRNIIAPGLTADEQEGAVQIGLTRAKTAGSV
ncbi:MAG: hypothetical protein Q7S31_00365 [bacterium]|nr:hypothetical protein [bacterium]